MDTRSPVHVVYGGADLYSADTPAKLGRIALGILDRYAPDCSTFADAMGLETEADTVYAKTIHKLEHEPVEDFRIDFEDGYGFRTDAEEDADAERTGHELARAFVEGTTTPFCGIRIRSLGPATHKRAVRTLEIFLENVIRGTRGHIPNNFVVTLPKVESTGEITELTELLHRFETRAGLPTAIIGIEIMIETPAAIFRSDGSIALRELVEASEGRCRSVHFGAYDYTSALGIVATEQRIDHPACDFARQMMLTALAPLGIRLSDSVTSKFPIPIHKGQNLGIRQRNEDLQAVGDGWREHFANVTRSMRNGFYQSWDLHPNQLPARYAAAYSFFLTARDEMAERLRRFNDRKQQATVTGNSFDDQASVNGILNFFRRGIDCGAFDEKAVADLAGAPRIGPEA